MKPPRRCLLAAAFLLACGPPPPPADSPEGRVTIRVNNGPKPGETERQEEYDLMVRMFEERHPDIRVVVTDWEYEPQGFAARAMAGELETVINTWATEGFRMIEEGLAADITDLMETWAPAAELDPQVAAPFVRDGRWYAMPIYAYTMALYLHRPTFVAAGIVDAQGQPDPPDTWEEFRETARRLTDPAARRFGFVMQAENPIGGWHFLNWGWQAGGEFEVRAEDGRWSAAFASPAVAEAFRFLQALRWDDHSIPPNALTRQREAWQMFAAGQAAMMMDAATEHFLNALRDEYGFDLADAVVAPLPAGPAGRAHQLGADYLMISSQASEPERRAAFAWLTWWHDPDWQEAKWALRARQGRAVGYPQVRIFRGALGDRLAQIIERHRTCPRFPHYEERIAGTLRTEPPIACQALYREVLTPVLQAILGDPGADPRTLLAGLAPRFEELHIAPFNQRMASR